MLKVFGALLLITSITGCSSLERNMDHVAHERCVYMMLDNGQLGESCKWRDGYASGTVQVAVIRPGNMCHELINTVEYKNDYKVWKETACPTKNNKWKFYD
jgi:hypothetical protein